MDAGSGRDGDSGRVPNWERTCRQSSRILQRLCVGWLAAGALLPMVGCRNSVPPPSRTQQASAEKLIAEGMSLLEQGQHQPAIAKFDAAIVQDRTSGRAYYCKGCALSESGNKRAAADAFRESARLAPHQAHLPLFNLANTLQELGDRAEAEATFRKVVEITPRDPDAWTNLGRLIDDRGEHEEAIRCYDQALEVAPDDVITLTNKGNALTALKRFDEALASYDAALKIAPKDRITLAARRHCESLRGNPGP